MDVVVRDVGGCVEPVHQVVRHVLHEHRLVFCQHTATVIRDNQSKLSPIAVFSGAVKGRPKGSPYSITERKVPELIPVLGSRPAGDVSHKPGGRLPLLSPRSAVTLETLKRDATNFAAW